MTDSSSDPEFSESFSSSSPEPGAKGFDEPADSPPWDGDGPEFGDEMEGSFALDMARIWVKQHQKAAMLGAFGVGVFVGALLRD